MGFGVWVLGFGIWGLGFGFGVWNLRFRVWGVGFRVSAPDLAGNRKELLASRVDHLSLSLFPGVCLPLEEGRYKAIWKREFKLPWRRASLLKSSR